MYVCQIVIGQIFNHLAIRPLGGEYMRLRSLIVLSSFRWLEVQNGLSRLIAAMYESIQWPPA